MTMDMNVQRKKINANVLEGDFWWLLEYRPLSADVMVLFVICSHSKEEGPQFNVSVARFPLEVPEYIYWSSGRQV